MQPSGVGIECFVLIRGAFLSLVVLPKQDRGIRCLSVSIFTSARLLAHTRVETVPGDFVLDQLLVVERKIFESFRLFAQSFGFRAGVS